MMAATPPHNGQRLKVGAIGLGAVILLLLLAGAVLRLVTRERAAMTAGAARPDLVANLAVANDAAVAEPLADMGVSPTAENAAAVK